MEWMQIVSAHVTLVLFSLQCRLMHLTNSNVLNIYEMVSKTPGQLNANPFSFLPILYLSSFKLSQQFDVWSITGQSVTDFSLLLTRCVCVGGEGGEGIQGNKAIFTSGRFCIFCFFIHTCTTENQGCYNWDKAS